jgi:hypothetical protein
MPNISIPARDNGTKSTQYVSRRINFNDSGVRVVGVIPAGAIVINAGIVVTTAFNAATTNVIDLGTGGDGDGFATDLAGGTIGRIPADELATSDDLLNAASDVTITAEYAQTGTAATAGSCIVFVEYITLG